MDHFNGRLVSRLAVVTPQIAGYAGTPASLATTDLQVVPILGCLDWRPRLSASEMALSTMTEHVNAIDKHTAKGANSRFLLNRNL